MFGDALPFVSNSFYEEMFLTPLKYFGDRGMSTHFSGINYFGGWPCRSSGG
jgi:hypothetical protein